MSDPVNDSSGNVFSDLGFEPGEAAILHMRAELMNDLRLYIRRELLFSQFKQVLVLPISFSGHGRSGIRGVGGSMDGL